MVNHLSGSVAVIALIALQTSCGGGGENSGVGPVINELEGIWRQNCQFDAEDSDFTLDTLDISGSEFTLTQSTFADEQCTDRQQAIELTGTYTIGQELPIADGGNVQELDLNLNQITLSLFTEDTVSDANAAVLCGSSSWEAGVSMDISNCADISGTDTPRQLFDIFRISGNQLFTGTEQGETPASRPTVLGTDSVFTRETPATQGGGTETPEEDPETPVVLPEASLALTANNGLTVAQFAISQFDLIKGLTNAGNTGVLSLSGNTSGRITGLYLTSICEGGGSANINGSPTQLATLSVQYTDCMIDGAIYNGNLSFSFAAVNGQLGDTVSDWSFSATASMDGLNVSSANRSIDLEGNFILTTVFTADTEITGGAVSRFQGIHDEVIFMREASEISRMTDFDFLFAYRSENPAIYSDDIDEARIASSIIGGQISLTQGSGFGGTGLQLPSSGELEVFGANGSMLEIDVEESDMVFISVDADGNGEFIDDSDTVISGSWSGFFVR